MADPAPLIRAGGAFGPVGLAQWRDDLAVDLVQDLRQAGIDGNDATHDPFEPSDRLDERRSGEIAQGQQEEQDALG